jgi:hypothetical protein
MMKADDQGIKVQLSEGARDFSLLPVVKELYNGSDH